MNTYGINLVGRRRRRQHIGEFKAAVIEQCMRPDLSIAAVATANSLDANLLRKYVTHAEQAATHVPRKPLPPSSQESLAPAQTFVPLVLTAPVVEGDCQVELPCAGKTVNIVWQGCCCGFHRLAEQLAEQLAEMICVNAMWLAAEPMDMRTGTDTALSRVGQGFGQRDRTRPICSPIAASRA